MMPEIMKMIKVILMMMKGMMADMMKNNPEMMKEKSC
jgi:hypothetical protein